MNLPPPLKKNPVYLVLENSPALKYTVHHSQSSNLLTDFSTNQVLYVKTLKYKMNSEHKTATSCNICSLLPILKHIKSTAHS